MWAWPNQLIRALFVLAVVSVVVLGLVNILLALSRRIRYRRRFTPLPDDLTGPPVSVVIAACNEELVIGATLGALCRSRYPNLVEVIVVDDGSTDRTAVVVSEIGSSEPRVRLLRQANSGKAAALNYGFAEAQAEIVVTLDADTVFTPTTVGALARRFALDTTGRLGAVAGVLKVGNQHNLLTRWQALEYIIQIGVDRAAQDSLRAIMVAPGACAAWRRDAVLGVGGYSRSTLAEDCDLVLELQQNGYEITQDDEAMCFTEAPETAGALARQRFRWMFGTIQAIWKHRRMIFNPRYGWLGMLTLPSAAISVLLPVLFLPFVYAMVIVTAQAQGLGVVLLYFALFTVAQLATAVIGVGLARERPTHLLIVPIYRLIYETLRAYVVYRSVLTMLRGTRSSWNQVERRGTVSVALLDVSRG
jgi:cellulose synthase/poly-beta-1,6-N-acetylglucosamine synthase-like glycosyltransferase